LDKKNIQLSDENHFELSIGGRLLKKDVFNSKDTIPIYSGSVVIPFGFTNKTIVPNFDQDYIIWGIDDAVFDFGFIPKGKKFTITDHCGMITIKNDKIVPEYLFYQLQLLKESLGFGWTYRASLTNIGNVEIPFPIKKDGTLDTVIQKDLALKFKIINESKKDLNDIKDSLVDVKISVDDNELKNFKHVDLDDKKLFTIDNGGRITKKDIQKAQGEIPVYSSSKIESNTLGHVSDKIKEVVDKAKFFEGTNLTVNADGSVGSVFIRTEKFYANDVCNIITINVPDIDPTFLKFELRTQIYTMGLDWANKLYKKKLRQIKVRIPITKNGYFDLKKQKSLAQKYIQAEKLKNVMCDELNSLLKVKVDF